jgi:trk system potassium uptake protein TrkA
LGDHIATLGDCEIVQFALDLSQTRSEYIKVSDLEKRHKIRVCAFERADGVVNSIPTPDSVLYHGDTVIVALRHGMIPEISKYMQN